jgi:hypothetical protein
MSGAMAGEQQQRQAMPLGFDDGIAGTAEGRVEFVSLAVGFRAQCLPQPRATDQSDLDGAHVRTVRKNPQQRQRIWRLGLIGRVDRSEGKSCEIEGSRKRKSDRRGATTFGPK